ncbi:MAG: 4Fe-4S binding protein, partial [Oscillospiraceae bacterium]
ELKLIMENAGFAVIAAGAFVGEHSFSQALGAGRPNDSDLADMDKFVEAIAKKLTMGGAGAAPTVSGNNPPTEYYTPRDRYGKGIDIRKVKPKTNDKCTMCGLCASLCPLGSISFEDFKTINGICMKCCACVKRCPVGAKYFDDEGYLYHKSELEAIYGDRVAENQLFY